MTRCLAALSLAALLLGAAPAHGFNGVEVAQVRKDAEAGRAEAQSQLGVLYAQGVGLARDKAEAVRWYRKAADQGYPVGQWNLAFMYVKGEGGVAVDYPRARELFRQAAQGGLAGARYDLGMMLLQGLGGEQDLDEAKNWFRMAAGQGYREAVKILKELEPEAAQVPPAP